MKKRSLALLLSLCLLLSAAPVYAGAATGQQISANAVTVTAGNTATVTVKAENFSAIAVFGLEIYYDASVLTLSSASAGSFLSGTQNSVNTAEAGVITMNAMSLEGVSGSGTILTLYFETAADCTPGTYSVKLAVGDAYAAGTEGIVPATIGAVNGSVTVKEQVATETFSIYNYVDKTTLQKGDVLSYRVASASSSRAFVSGEFLVEYDSEIFAFEEASLESALTGEGAIYSINSGVQGQVRIAYAKDSPVKDFYLFTVKLKVIADTEGSTTVKASANNMYREDLSQYLPGSASKTLTLTKLPEVVDDPDAFLETEALITGQQSKSLYFLEAGAGVAAADFTLTYDPAVLRCVSVTAAEGLSDLGGMVVINDNYGAGSIRFSYVNESANKSKLPLVEILWEPLTSPENHYQITGSGKGVVDAKQNAIPLEYVTDTGCIHICTVVPPTCLEDGYTDYTCACGDSYQEDPVEKLGHDYQTIPARAPTCTEIGWEADYQGCTRCDYGTRVELPALGHQEVSHKAAEPTCTEIGWSAYNTCERCDYTTFQAIEPLGHRVKSVPEISGNPFTVTNISSVPFLLKNGVYYSQNHTDSSSSQITLTAAYAYTLHITCGVSSEQKYDKLFILHNGTQLEALSGTVTEKKLSVAMETGDTLVIRYQKDGSVSRNDDQGWAQLSWTLTEQIVPAEGLMPTCTEAVVCAFCEAQVKAPLGHSYEKDLLVCDRGDHTRAVTAISLQSLPAKLDYIIGREVLDVTGGVLCVQLDDGQSVCLPLTEEMVTGFDNTVLGEKLLTVTFGGAQTQFAVVIVKVPPAIVVQPQPVTAESGNEVQFSVVAEGNPVSYKWEYRKIYKWFNTAMEGYKTDTLTVPAIGARNGYDYRCLVTFADGTQIYSQPAELTVNTYITDVVGPNDQTVVLGYKGQFTASAEGEGLRYQWQYCRPNSELWIDTAMEGATRATVMIETTKARDGYRYRCVITDVTGNVEYTEAATMRVLSFTAHPREAFAAVGETAVFAVQTSAPEGFTYQWQYRRSATANWTNTTMTGYNTATLTVAATAARNGYQYRCVLTGSKNSQITSKSAVLHVGDPVVFTTQPADATAAVGEVATFTVVAENAYAYQWQYCRPGSTTWNNTGADGNQTATLNWTTKSSNNGYKLRCVVYGLDGREYISDTAKLTIG